MAFARVCEVSQISFIAPAMAGSDASATGAAITATSSGRPSGLGTWNGEEQPQVLGSSARAPTLICRVPVVAEFRWRLAELICRKAVEALPGMMLRPWLTQRSVAVIPEVSRTAGAG